MWACAKFHQEGKESSVRMIFSAFNDLIAIIHLNRIKSRSNNGIPTGVLRTSGSRIPGTGSKNAWYDPENSVARRLSRTVSDSID